MVIKILTAVIGALVLVSGYVAGQLDPYAKPPEPVVFKGTGSKTLEPIDVLEGTLTFHIKSTTSCRICVFTVGFDKDNNLDGVFGGDGDYWWGSVFDEGYEVIQNLDTVVNATTAGGRIRVTIDAPGDASWEVTVTQHPEPKHSIEVGVFDARYKGGPSWKGIIDNAEIVLVDSNNNQYKPEGFSTYGKAHYYFNRYFFGYVNYTITVSAPGYASQTGTVTLDDWKSLGYPGWPLYVKFYLQPGGNAVIYCKVRDAKTKEPIKGATVTAKDSAGNRVASTTTDQGGWCSFENLNKGTYTLTVSAEGYKEVSKPAEAATTRTIEPVLFELERSSPGVYGTVTNRLSGHPVENITVWLTNYAGDEVLGRTKTDSNGFYTFPKLTPGKYGVNVVNAFRDERFYEPFGRIVTLEGTEYKRVDFVVRPKGVDVTAGFDVVPGKEAAVAAGSNYTIDVVVSNNGPKDAEDVRLQVDVASGSENVEFASATPSEGSCGRSGDEVKCTLGGIKKNGVKRVELSLKALKTGSFTLKALAADAPIEDWEMRDWLPINNRDNMTVKIKPYRIYGKVVTPSSAPMLLGNILLPIKNVPVIISLKNGGENYTVFTDKEGKYSFEINESDKNNFQIEVSLRDKENIIVIHSGRGFNNATVKLRTKKFDVKGDEARIDVLFHWLYANLDASMTANQSRVLQDAAVYYYHNYEAVLFAKDKLKLNFDHELPVDIYLYLPDPGCGACYSINGSYIEVNNSQRASSMWSPDSPDNREYHEFGHHVNADSKMMGENTFPDLAALDESHGGVDNSNSMDSVMEGFAEFFSLLVKDSPRYRWDGTVTNLERNYHTLIAAGKPDEEFNVAALLWDLVDKNKETGRRGGDYISLGAEKTWKVLNQENITTVRALYLAFNRSIGNQDTNRTDGLSDLDALFVLHRFYSDKNNNTRYDRGELIGYADYWNPRTNRSLAPRQGKPRIPGTALEFSIVDEKGNKVDANVFNVSVYFPGGEDDFSYVTWADPDDGYLWVVVPADALRVEIAPVVAGYAGIAFVQEPEAFWGAVAKAQRENKSAYATHEFRVKENDIPAPEGFVAEPLNDTSIKLTWKSAGNAALVRGVDHFPAYLADGEVIYTGRGEEFVDTGLLTGITYYYTLFTVVDDQLSRGAEARATTGEVAEKEPLEEQGAGGLSLIALVIVLIAVGAIAWRRFKG